MAKARMVGGDEDGHVSVWDARGGTQLLRLAGHHGAVTSVAWSPDGSRLGSGGGSRDAGELVVWDAHSGERHPAWEAGSSALAGHPGVVSALTWAPSGELVLSGGSDGRLRWWKVQSVRLSIDGSRLASCGDDGSILLWDLHSSEHLQTLRRDRPYERLNISGIRSLTEAQKATLRALGAVEDEASHSPSHAPQL